MRKHCYVKFKKWLNFCHRDIIPFPQSPFPLWVTITQNIFYFPGGRLLHCVWEWCSAPRWAVASPVGHARNTEWYFLLSQKEANTSYFQWVKRSKYPCTWPTLDALFYFCTLMSFSIQCIPFLMYNSLWYAGKFSLKTAIYTQRIPPLLIWLTPILLIMEIYTLASLPWAPTPLPCCCSLFSILEDQMTWARLHSGSNIGKFLWCWALWHSMTKSKLLLLDQMPNALVPECLWSYR